MASGRERASSVCPARIQLVGRMATNKVFPDRPLAWYLIRGTLAGGGIGAVLEVLLVVFLSGMGDAPIADDVRDGIPYVVGWAIMGFVFGLVWWLLAKTVRRPSS